ncbi:MAG TPA: phosphoribosylanthranilate isomerase [Armatimonadota bacterium]|jgi:phosphoribosylanthranilate isomerase
MPVHIKICGITNPEDALAAVEAGADALGLVFAPSPRCVTLEQAKAIRMAVPSDVELVGVFVNEDFMAVHDAVLTAHLGGVQFYRNPISQWTEAECVRWLDIVLARGVRVVRAFPARDVESLRAELRQLPQSVDQILLDAFVSGVEGGTGKTFDWTLAAAAKEFGNPVIIAGGLTPDNVADAIRLTQPWGVDVSSGVESSPGRKDADAMRRFVTNARAASL